ncbi:LuxR C-terminal-related transcriptional regulator [Streptomyces sp. NPDC021020]|uniref:helix-turn-helix transcriptional regulator n=1 Tax=Streptomyces sp. NPDC021020 TaxID=3365109 RepID=UPI0037AB38BA
MGLIRPVGRGGAMVPVEPDAAMKQLFESQAERLRGQAAEVALTHDRAQEIATRYRPAAMRETVGVEVDFVGDGALRAERLRSLHLSSRESMWSMHPGPLPPAEVLARSLELDAELVARGLDVRAVYGRAVAAAPSARKYLEHLAALGVEVRLADRVPFDLLLFDGTTAVMPSRPERPLDPMLVLHGSELMGTYIAMYLDVWARSAPFSGRSGGEEGGAALLSEREGDVLRLLAEGLTDEQIGKRLGISARTVRRIATTVMEQLGAASRFQAGVLAAGLGLVG